MVLFEESFDNRENLNLLTQLYVNKNVQSSLNKECQIFYIQHKMEADYQGQIEQMRDLISQTRQRRLQHREFIRSLNLNQQQQRQLLSSSLIQSCTSRGSLISYSETDSNQTYLPISYDDPQRKVLSQKPSKKNSNVYVKKNIKSQPEKSWSNQSISQEQRQKKLQAQKQESLNLIQAWTTQHKNSTKYIFEKVSRHQKQFQKPSNFNLGCQSFQYGKKVLLPFVNNFNLFLQNPKQTLKMKQFLNEVSTNYQVDEWCSDCKEKKIEFEKLFQLFRCQILQVQKSLKKQSKQFRKLLESMKNWVQASVSQIKEQFLCPKDNFKAFCDDIKL